MVTTQTDCSSLEQRSVLNFLVAKKCKIYEIYGKMCDVYWEPCLVRNIYKWVGKTVHEGEAYGLSGKEKKSWSSDQ